MLDYILQAQVRQNSGLENADSQVKLCALAPLFYNTQGVWYYLLLIRSWVIDLLKYICLRYGRHCQVRKNSKEKTQSQSLRADSIYVGQSSIVGLGNTTSKLSMVKLGKQKLFYTSILSAM